MVLTILGVIGIFAIAIYIAMYSIEIALVIGLEGLVALVYVFVLNHLRHKGDMDTSQALIPTVNGGVVEVKKKSSIWISIALGLAILGLVGSIGITLYGLYLYITYGMGQQLAVSGGIATLVIAMYIAILNFLRTKIDFVVDRAVIKTVEGYLIELYKKRSIWLTIGMIVSIIGAIAAFAIGIMAILSNGVSIPLTNINTYLTKAPSYSMQLQPSLIQSIIQGIPMILIGLALLISVAILNFLRIRGHVRLLQQYPAPVSTPTVVYVQQQSSVVQQKSKKRKEQEHYDYYEEPEYENEDEDDDNDIDLDED